MPITMESIEQVMKDKMSQYHDYKLARHKDVLPLLGRGYERVAEVKDATDDKASTMVVMAKVKPPPKPKAEPKPVLKVEVQAKPEPKLQPKVAAPPVKRLDPKPAPKPTKKKTTFKKKTS